jgi:hypothetical protein
MRIQSVRRPVGRIQYKQPGKEPTGVCICVMGLGEVQCTFFHLHLCKKKKKGGGEESLCSKLVSLANKRANKWNVKLGCTI